MMKNTTRFWTKFFTAVFCLLIFSALTADLAADELKVTWNKNTEVDLSGYKVYWGTSSRVYSNNFYVGTDTTYTVPNLSQGNEYFFAVTAIDTANNESAYSDEVNYYIAPSDNTAPTLASLQITSATNIEIIFSEQVDKTTAETFSNYQINNNISVLSAVLDANGQMVTLTTSPHNTSAYEITINNITDLAGNQIAANTQYQYSYEERGGITFEVVDVQVIDYTHLDITFSNSVDPTSAQNISNYEIFSGVSVVSAVVDGSGDKVHLVTSLHLPDQYMIRVVNIQDVENPPNTISESTHIYNVSDVTHPHVDSVRAEGETNIYVVFDESIDTVSAETVSNYQVSPGITILNAEIATNNTVNLTTTPHAEGSYTLQLSGVKDLVDPPNSINPPISHSYDVADIWSPTIDTVEFTNERQIDVIFSETVEKNSAESESNYQIFNGITIFSAELDQDDRTVHLTTSFHSEKVYYLTATNIKDQATNPNTIVNGNKIYEFVDTFAPYVESVTAINKNLVDVLFSESMDETSVENIENFNISPTISISSAILDNDGKTVHLTTGDHSSGNYTLSANNSKDLAENVMSEGSSIPYSFVDNTPPSITNIEVVDRNTLHVYFSEAVEKTSVENISNYGFNNGITIATANLDQNHLFVQLKTSDHSEETYTITITGVLDQSIPPNEIDTTSQNYQFIDSQPPEIEEVVAVDKNTVKIEFSEKIEGVSAVSLNNYQIENNLQVLNAELDSSETIVFLSTSDHVDGNLYFLTVENIKDKANTPNTIVKVENRPYSFADTEQPTLVSAQAVLGNKVSVIFSEPVDEASAETFANYQVDNNIVVSGAKLQADLVTVELTTSTHVEGDYTVSVSNVKDRAASPNTIAPNSALNYAYGDETKPTIASVQAENENLLVVKFSEAVEQASAELKGNYTISDGIQVNSATLVSDSTVQLVTSKHLVQGYTLTVNNVRDRAATPNTIEPNSTYGYQYIDTTSPELVSAQSLSETKVTVIFTEPVEQASAETEANYSITNGISVAQAVLQQDLLTVELTTSAHVEGNYTVSVSNVKDRAASPNTIAPNSSLNYAYADEIKPRIVSVRAENENQLVVKFSEALEQVSAELKGNYTISDGIQVSSATLVSDSTVQLATSWHSEQEYTLAVNNVKDRAANPNTIEPNSTYAYHCNDTTPPELVSTQSTFENKVRITFSEAVEEASAETSANYSITNNISVLAISLQPDLVTVELTTSVHVEGNYTVSVSNVKDRATTPNTIAPNSSMNYAYVDQTKPTIASVQPVNGNLLAVTFSEPVEQASTELKGNYTISGGIEVSSATLVSDSTVQLTTSLHLEQGYTLTVSNVKDRAAIANTILPDSDFNYQYIDTTQPELVSAQTTLENKVAVIFSEPVEEATAETAANYTITNNISVLAVSLQPDLVTVELTTSAHVEGDYTVSVSNVKDRATNPNTIAPNSSLDYNYVDTIKPTILSAQLDKDHKLIVKFSEALDQASAQLKSNFTISGGIVIHSATLMSDSTVQLVTSKHSELGYTLTVNNVKDRAANPNAIEPNSTYSYQYDDLTPPELVSAQSTLENKVELTFSEPVEEASAETAANYTINNNISVLAASLQPDLVTVELTTSVHAEGNYSVVVNNVKDRATTPNTIAPNSSQDYAYVDITKPTIVSAQPENEYLLVVNFSEPLEQASAEQKSNYSISGGIQVNSATLMSDSTVQLATSQHQELQYTLTVSGVRDQGANPNTIQPNSTYSYQFDDSMPPELVSAQAPLENKVVLTFSEPVEEISAETVTNYTITNSITVLGASLQPDLITVELTTSVHTESDYTISVSNVKDRATNPNTIDPNSSANYSYVDNTKPTVASIQPENENSLLVKFSEPVEQVSAEQKSNYTISGGVQVINATLVSDSTVQLAASKHSEQQYTLTVNNVRDRAANPNSILPNSNYSYQYNDTTPPELVSAQATSENKVVLTFSEPMEETSVETPANYSIATGITVFEASLQPDLITVELTTSTHAEDNYTVSVSNVKDRAATPNIIDPNSSANYGYVDQTKPTIASVQPVDEYLLVVKFSESVEQVSAEQKDNYSISSGIQVISATLVTDSTVQLATSKHDELQYILTVSGVRDRAANPNTIQPNSTLSYQFMDTIPPELVSVQAPFKNKVMVTFSEPVAKSSAENMANYTISNSISVLEAVLQADLITIELTTSDHGESVYTIAVSNVKDRATTPNTIAPYSTLDYSYNDNVKPTIISAQLENENLLVVKFSESVEQASAEQMSNYSISNGIQINNTTLVNDSTVHLSTSKHFELQYTLTVNNVRDRAANPNTILSNSTYSYQYNDTTTPELLSAEAPLENKVVLTFSEPMEETSVEIPANYSIATGITVLEASLQPDLVTVELITSVHVEDNYTVTVNNLKDRAIIPNTIAPNSSLNYNYVDITKPSIVSAQLENENSLLVKFSEAVEQASVEQKANYSISNGIQIISATLVSDSTVQLATSQHLELQYTLTVNNVRDRAANPNTILPNSNYSYQYNDTTPPELVSAQTTSENKVVLTFSEPMEETSVETPTNFSIATGIAVLEASLQPDLVTVELTTSVHVEDNYAVTVNNLKDRAIIPNTIAPNSSANYTYVDNTKPAIASAQLANENLLVVKFSEPVKQTSAELKSNYTISGGIQISSAALVSDSTVQLATSKHLEQPYTITVNNVRDRASNPNTIQPNSTYSYQYNDTTPPELLAAQATVENKVTVTFDEPIEEASAETAANYSITNDVSVLAASLQPDLLTVELTTSIHTEGVYSVSVSNVRDRATTPNTIAPSSSANYTYVDNTAPAIASVHLENENLLVVKYTEPVEQASAGLIGNYGINNGIQISSATLVSDSIIHLATSEHLELQYTLTVNNVRDRAATPNTILPNSTYSYQYNDTTPPELVSAQSPMENKVVLTFSEPIQEASAETQTNYSIATGITVLEASLQPDLVTVELITSIHAEGNYTVTVNNVKDRAANANPIAPNSLLNYNYVDVTKPTIASVNIDKAHKLFVHFSEPVDQSTAQQKSNYAISGGIQINSAALVSDSVVQLVTSDHLEQQYTLTVNNVKDRAANGNTILNNSQHTYQYTDTTPPTMADVKATLKNKVTLTFSEAVEQNSAEQTGNYSISNGIEVQTAVLISDSKVQLVTSDHQEIGYTITVNSVRDRAANPNAILPNSTYGYQFNDTTPPELVTAQAPLENKVTVTFNEPVEAASAETAANYSITGNTFVLQAALQADMVTVELRTSVQAEGNYTVSVSNVKDRATTPNTIAANSALDYAYVDVTLPTITSVQIENENSVVVKFSEPVEQVTAEQQSNYSISDGIVISSATLVSDSTVQLATSKHEEIQYTLTVNNIKDRAANSNTILPNSTYSYQYNDITPPELVSAQAQLENKLTVVFSEPMEQASAENTGNYLISNNVLVLEASLQADLMTVELITSVHTEDNYTVSVNNVKDRATNPNTIAVNSALNYTYVDNTKPTIASVSMENENSVLVKFSEPVEQTSAELKTNYSIDGGIEISGVTLLSDSTVQLATSEHLEQVYTLTINNVRDRAASPNTILPDSKYSYQFNDTTPPELVIAQSSLENKVSVTFSEPVDLASAEIAANYSITNNVSVLQASLQQDLLTVELTTSVQAEGNYTVTVNNVKDRAVNPNSIDTNSTLNYVYVDATKPSIASVLMQNETSLLVKFSEPVDQASVELKTNYGISGGIEVSGAVLLSDSTVQLTTSKHVEQGYTLTVNNIKDRAASPNTILPNSNFNFQYNDITLPELVSAQSILENKVIVTFSEPMEEASVETAANYSITNNITVLEATLQADLVTVELTTSVHAEDDYSVTVENVKDRANIPNTIANNSFVNYAYVDVTLPTIVSVLMEDENSLLVKFSEPLEQASAEQKDNYGISDGIEVAIATLVSDSTVQIVTSLHLEQQYTLTVNNVKDKAANPNAIAPNSSFDYGYVDITLPTIVAVNIEKDHKLEVSFSEPVDLATAQDKANYSISGGIKIISAALVKDSTVQLVTTKHMEQQYSLTVSDVKDRASNPNTIEANSEFTYQYVDITAPTLVDAQSQMENKVLVSFSEPVELQSAQAPGNYQITNNISVISAILYPDLTTVELTTTVHAEGNYTITVINVKDRANNPNTIDPNNSLNYTYGDNTKPMIVSVQIEKEDTVVVKFSEPVDQTTAEEKNNYSISGGIEIYSAVLVSDSTVKITTSAHLEQEYTLTVKKVKDRANNPNTIVPNSTFLYEYFDTTPPTIVDAQAQVENKVIITFSELMEESSTENVSNYSINNGITVLAAQLQDDLKTVELTTTIHDEVEYRVTVNNLKDRAKTPNSIEPNSGHNYAYADIYVPWIASVELFIEDTVLIKFNEAVESLSATFIDNYIISGNIQIFSAIQVDDSTIKLHTSPHAEQQYTLTINNVKDRANNPNVIDPNSTYSYTYVDNTLPEIEKVEAEEFALHVTFSEPVDLSSAVNVSNYSVEGVDVFIAQLDTNLKTVHLSTTKHFEQTYTLAVSNIKDRAQTPNTILPDSKSNYEYVDVVAPIMTEAKALSKDTVLVKFNEPVQQASVENTSNYIITDGIQINAATLVNDSAVYLVTSDHLEQVYTVTANNILDRAKNPNEGDNLSFNYEYVDTDPLLIATVQALVEDTVVVMFNKPVDQVTAMEVSNYSISGGVQVLGVSLNENEFTVHLHTTPHVETTYTLTVSNVTDRANDPNPIGKDNTKQYDYIDTTLPIIKAVAAPLENMVEILFSEPVATVPAENVSNYVIDGIQIDSASLGDDKFTVNLFTNKHEEISYTITINNILDLANTPNEIAANSKFTYEYIDVFGPEIDSVKALIANQVDIYFSESVDEVTAEEISNYNINNGVEVDSAWLDVDLRIVHLKTSDHTPRNYILTVENVLDRAKNPNPVKSGTYAQYVYTDITAPYVTEISTWEKVNVSITYSEPMEALSAQDTANYNIKGKIKIESAKLLEDQKTVHLITSEHTAGEYSLKIKKVFDLAATPNEIDTTITYAYIDNDAPQALSVVTESDTCIAVSFDEPIEISSATDTLNYSINPYVHISSISLDASNQLVRIYTGKHPEGNFTVSVKNIKDVSDSANVMVNETTLNYSYVDLVQPEIDSVYTASENEVIIIFSEKVDEASAVEQTNYEILEGGGLNGSNMNFSGKTSKTLNDAKSGISQKKNIQVVSSDNSAHNNVTSGSPLSVLAITLESDDRTVRIQTNAQQEIGYRLIVNNVKDRANNPNVIKSNTVYKYEYVDVTPPRIYHVEVPIDSVINISFSEDLDKASAEIATNYFIDNNVTVKKASLDTKNENIVHLETTNHEYNVLYKITINNVKDRAKKENAITVNSNQNYTYLDTHAPFVDSTKLVNAFQLQVFFNESMDSTSAKKLENYTIAENIHVLGVEMDSSNKVVTLTTSLHEQDSTYFVTIKDILDLSSNVLDTFKTNYTYVKEDIALVDGFSQPEYVTSYVNVGGSCYMGDNDKVTHIPKQYAGVMWIKTKKEDLENKTDKFFTFTLSDTSTVCVVYDGNATNPPNWLKNNFEKTDDVITIDDNLVFNIWEAIKVPGDVTLGGNSAAGAENVSNMYLVLLVNETYRRAGAMEDMNDPDDSGEITDYKLFQNYPNPFNAQTDIKFQLPVNAEVELNIFNIRGQLVRELVQEEIGTGSHFIKWDGKDRYGTNVITGQYFVRMTVKEKKHVDSMTLKNISYEKVIKMMYIK